MIRSLRKNTFKRTDHMNNIIDPPRPNIAAQPGIIDPPRPNLVAVSQQGIIDPPRPNIAAQKQSWAARSGPLGTIGTARLFIVTRDGHVQWHLSDNDIPGCPEYLLDRATFDVLTSPSVELLDGVLVSDGKRYQIEAIFEHGHHIARAVLVD
jgi:hypothetical protein